MIPGQRERVTKALPTETRRRTVRLLAGAPLAGLLASLVSMPAPARAKKRRGRRRKSQRNGRDAGRTPDRNASGHNAICPPDPRLTAIETCRARQGGVAVPGACDCAWVSGDPGDFPCRDTCLCWLTVEGTGFCGTYSPPLPDEGSQGCSADLPCPPITLGGQVFDQACVVWPNGGGPFCWPACAPREP